VVVAFNVLGLLDAIHVKNHRKNIQKYEQKRLAVGDIAVQMPFNLRGFKLQKVEHFATPRKVNVRIEKLSVLTKNFAFDTVRGGQLLQQLGVQQYPL
jgi:hypothetical protein